MPHVTFIHGLSNKPEAEALHQIWLRALAKGSEGLDLVDCGVTSSMVYWADVVYPEPGPNLADYESTEERTAEQVDGSGDAEIPDGETAAERVYLAAARRRMTEKTEQEVDRLAAQPANSSSAWGATELERVPLPWFIKKKIMAAYIRDAYLYLFDKSFSPRPGTMFAVQKELRQRFIEHLCRPEVSEPHVVVSHSMGTMIAYDCLKRVPGCRRINGLITMGSPLGVDEVQDCFKPEWDRTDGFPDAGVADWVNLFDRRDVVCAADPALTNDYRRAGKPAITDTEVTNDGAWRHSVVKYLARRETRKVLGRLLGL